ncbi:MAG: hypothetical protein WDA20_06610 [Desulfuromonadales bacterium]|jgi:hypothetical protein
MRKQRIWLLPLVLLLLLAFGCAGTGKRTQELLGQDYQTMSDTELQTYYFQLNDQIARVERAASGTSVGLGVGGGPVRVGVGQGISRGVIADDLRQRRNEVRGELSVRGLRP